MIMNLKKCVAAVMLGASTLAFAQEQPKPIFQVDALKNVDINLLLRSSYEAPYTENGGVNTNNLNGFKMNEARLEIRGKIVEDLEFRVRTRLHKAGSEATLDRSTSALDHASLAYRFGEKKDWQILVGKQNNMMGSWEFDKNPTFEYQYSHAVGGYNNLFGLGARVSYSPNANHTFTIQAQNTHNNSFNTLTAGKNIGTNLAARTPLLYQAVWQGKFFNKVLNTWYSVGTSKVAQGKNNFHLSLGNKVVAGNFEAYLDLATTNFAFDHFGYAGKAYNGLTEDINVKSAVLRMDYKFLPKWNVTAKGFYETASGIKENTLAKNFKTNTGYLFGVEFLPIAKQNFRFFAYYYGNDLKYKNIPTANVHSNVFAIGALYSINVL